MAIAMPTKGVRSRYTSADFDAVQVFGAVPNAQRASYPGLSTHPTPKLEVASAPMVHFSLV